jgi:hypothetical protein
MTDNMGRVVSVNPSAQCPKSKQVGETLQTVLKSLLGNPHALLSHLRRMMVEQSHVSEIFQPNMDNFACPREDKMDNAFCGELRKFRRMWRNWPIPQRFLR